MRRREKIEAGRPTSFTWLRRTYSKTWLGELVLWLPKSLQNPAFMAIQYAYAVFTMLPCPIWYSSRTYSIIFLSLVGLWSVWNGATYYIDHYKAHFEKQLEEMRNEVQNWQHSQSSPTSPALSARSPTQEMVDPLSLGSARESGSELRQRTHDAQ